MERLAKAAGRTTRCRYRPFRDLYAPESTPSPGGTLSRHRNGSFFHPALRGRRSDATSVATRNSQLGPDLSISCVMLRAYGLPRRSARHGSAAARHNDRGGPECRALAQPRAPRAFSFRPAPGGRRDDMSQTRRLAAILAADVVGYARLIGADEGGTLQAFKTIKA